MEYKIVFDSFPEGLEDKVNEMIGQGWRPQGGIAVSSRNDMEFYFYQAVTRED